MFFFIRSAAEERGEQPHASLSVVLNILFFKDDDVVHDVNSVT